jgi:hypothetical protein
MDRLCMIMHLTTLYTSCIVIILEYHACMFAIDHAKQGPKEPPEPAQVEGINPEQD